MQSLITKPVMHILGSKVEDITQADAKTSPGKQRRAGSRTYRPLRVSCRQHVTQESSFRCGLTLCCVSADNWSQKAVRRKTTGTGRMRYLKDMSRRFKNGFREGGVFPLLTHLPAGLPIWSREQQYWLLGCIACQQ